MAKSKPDGSSKKQTPPDPSVENPAGAGDIQTIISLLSRFDRFGWDIFGVLFLALAMVTLLGLLNLTNGAWITLWIDFLERLLGWGSVFLVITMAAIGLIALRHRTFKLGSIRLGRILSLQGAAFSLLALLSMSSGSGFTQIEQGGGRGGLVGWGLAELILLLVGSTWSPVVAACALISFIVSGSGLPSIVVRMIDRKIGEDDIDHQGTGQKETPKPNIPDGSLDKSPLDAPPARAGDPKRISKVTQLPKRNLNAPGIETSKTLQLPPRDERLPPLALLIGEQNIKPDERVINSTAGLIEKTMTEFGVPAKVIGYRIGPTVTQFAVEPGFVEKSGPDGTNLRQKVRVAQISALAKDLALALSAERLRIEAPVSGQSYVGIEVPNDRSSIVRLRPILESDVFHRASSPLSLAMGRDVSGQPVVADLARMPHMLIAGTTGSGKSICIEAITTCLVVNNTPADLRLVMIDPKMVELVRFNGLPHLYGKVETDLERILAVLRWALVEMDHRYRLFEQARARDISTYNRKMEKRKQPALPRIVILIDELADLMMSAPDQTEQSIVRLAQMARATGIHLVVATQRPSTDVVTGLIKANFPSRISFTVASSIDSRVILDTTGAETLLGRGDMLFLNPESGTPLRAQGVLVTDQEVERVIDFWQKMSPHAEPQVAPWEEMMGQGTENGDALIQRAIQIVKTERRASASLLQRRLRIGYPRAARLIDELEEKGVVGPSQGGGRDREVLAAVDEDDQDEDQST